MATLFDSQFARSGFPMLLRQFGESITYLPAAGGRRSVSAIIERSPPAILDAAGNAVLPTATIRVYNSCRSGISSREVDIGKDEVEFVLRIGETMPRKFSLMTLLSQDAGVTQLAVI